MNRKSSIRTYACLALILSAGTVIAQNAKVGWFSLSMGYANSSNVNSRVLSVVGQSFVGTSQQGNTGIKSGFLTDTLFNGPVLGVTDGHTAIPRTFALEQNFPNPFNPTTLIQYELPVASKVTLKVYDVLGREVVSLVDEIQHEGVQSASMNAGNLASGVYMYRLVATGLYGENKTVTFVRRMLLVK